MVLDWRPPWRQAAEGPERTKRKRPNFHTTPTLEGGVWRVHRGQIKRIFESYVLESS